MSILFRVLLFAISIPFTTAGKEPQCSKFDYDERILRKLLLQEKVIQDLEADVGKLKAAYDSQISSLENKLQQATRRYEDSCTGTIIYAAMSVSFLSLSLS